MKILVTGFEPFGNNTVNPSSLAVELLPERIAGADIIKQTLPVAFGRAADMLIGRIHDLSPDAVICTGLAGRRNGIMPELIAVNLKNTSISDNSGKQPVWEKILPEGEDGLFSTLPVREMAQELALQGIPSEVSLSAGTYVCNEVMYRLLALQRKEFPDMMAGFIHVPYALEYLPDGSDAFSMPIGNIMQALEICISITAGKIQGTKL